MKLISKFALLFVLLALLFLLLSGNLFSPSPIVIIVQVLAVGLSIWARRSFETGQFNIHADPVGARLLSRGPYRIIRHPMYAAALLFIWASVLGHWSLITVVVGLIVTATTATRIVTEERLLRTRYPDYAEYSRKTKRLIPFLI